MTLLKANHSEKLSKVEFKFIKFDNFASTASTDAPGQMNARLDYYFED
jgi:hypothetical protein